MLYLWQGKLLRSGLKIYTKLQFMSIRVSMVPISSKALALLLTRSKNKEKKNGVAYSSRVSYNRSDPAATLVCSSASQVTSSLQRLPWKFMRALLNLLNLARASSNRYTPSSYPLSCPMDQPGGNSFQHSYVPVEYSNHNAPTKCAKRF